MYIFTVPYEWIQQIFGTFVADNFNTIMLIITIIGFIIAVIPKKRNNWLEEAQNRQNKKFEKNYNIQPKKQPSNDRSRLKEEIRIKYKLTKNQTFDEWIEEHKDDGYQGNQKEGIRWYPTGWTYNEKTELWEPPDYLKKETSEKWKWDPEKRIWIDKEKEKRMERYREYHKDKPPTFEEWKAQKLKEKAGTDIADCTNLQK